MAELDRDALAAELQELAAKLRPQFAADKARVQAEGRAFNPLQWVAGTPDSGKYPAGPAYVPMGMEPTLFQCLMLMNAQDVAVTALGSAFFYAMGFAHGPKLGVKSAHKLGFWTAVPAVVLGLLGGVNKGVYRYAGFMDNGNAPLYPGYTESAAPYFLKHKVSDRVADIAPSLHMDPSKSSRQSR